MSIVKPIRSIEGFTEAGIKEKGSGFTGQAYFMSDSDECVKKLNEIKKEFYDATHHCYCYKLNSGENRYSDNGEPNGTAGIRILNAIEHFDLTDLIVMVIRYFGGTKLGVGPLGKAYYETAYNTLQAAGIIVKNPYNEIKITTNFDQMGHVFRILSGLNSKNIKSEYKESVVEINCYLNVNDIAALSKSDDSFSRGDIDII